MNRHSITQRATLVFVALASFGTTAQAQDFALQVGPPAAAMPQPGTVIEKKVSKDVVFVVRPLGCVDPAGASITATAEGLLDGSRRSLALRLVPLPTPGVRAVSGNWPDGGVWVIRVAGTCAGRSAGAIVTLGPRNTYHRDGVELVALHPTPEHIERALRASGRNGGPAATSR
jgi:hypothetical protein